MLFSHRGHSIRMVGNVVSSCSSFPIIATNCLGLCSIILPLIIGCFSSSCFLCPHFVHVNIIMVCFPELTFTGFSREPHSAQNSIQQSTPFSKFKLVNQRLTLAQTKRLRKREGEHSFVVYVSVNRWFARRFWILSHPMRGYYPIVLFD